MKGGEEILHIDNICKNFDLGRGKVLKACDCVDIIVHKAETVGIVGESGSGKSTVAKMLTRLYDISAGKIIFHGEDITRLKGEALRQHRKKIQMVFQDPSTAFNPKMRVRDIICEPLKNFGMIKNSEVDAKAREMLRLVELPEEFSDRYANNMSGGQRQRIAIARALVLEPEIIICDEATSALDMSVQKTVIELLTRLQRERQVAYLFICHDLAMISSIAHQIAVMYMGNIVEILPGEEVARGALHPYTKALLQSVFDLHMDFNKPITPLEGEASMPTGELQGCPFQNRCAFCMEKCQKEKPELKTLDENHQIACWRI